MPGDRGPGRAPSGACSGLRAARAEEVARRLPDGRLVLIPGVAHTLVFTAPEQLATVSRQFLAGGDGNLIGWSIIRPNGITRRIKMLVKTKARA
jgi:hypothetical protein